MGLTAICFAFHLPRVKALNDNTENIYPGSGSQVQSVPFTMKRKSLTTIPNAMNIPARKKKKKFRSASALGLTL